MSAASRYGYAVKISSAFCPAASSPSTRDTGNRRPRMHGFPVHTAGSIVILSKPCIASRIARSAAVSQLFAPFFRGDRRMMLVLLDRCLSAFSHAAAAGGAACPRFNGSARSASLHAAAAGGAACPRARAAAKAAATAAWRAAARSPDEPWLRPRLRKPAGAMDGPAGANHRMPPCVRQGVMCDGWSRNQIRSHSSVIARRSSDV